MISFGDAFTLVHSIMTFLIVTDVFYERIIQNKLLPKMNSNTSLLDIAEKTRNKLQFDEYFLKKGSDIKSSLSSRTPLITNHLKQLQAER